MGTQILERPPVAPPVRAVVVGGVDPVAGPRRRVWPIVVAIAVAVVAIWVLRGVRR